MFQDFFGKILNFFWLSHYLDQLREIYNNVQ